MERRMKNKLLRQHKNDSLMTPSPPPPRPFHISRMLFGAMFVLSTCSKQRTYVKVVLNTYIHSILQLALLASLRSYFEPLLGHSTPTQSIETGAGSVPVPCPSTLLSSYCTQDVPPDSHPWRSTYFTPDQINKHNCSQSSAANCKFTFHLNEEKYSNHGEC
jgi:hypothetical protein